MMATMEMNYDFENLENAGAIFVVVCSDFFPTL